MIELLETMALFLNHTKSMFCLVETVQVITTVCPSAIIALVGEIVPLGGTLSTLEMAVETYTKKDLCNSKLQTT